MASKKQKIPWNVDVLPDNERFVADPNFTTSADSTNALTLSINQLSQMSNDDLMDRASQIDEQATLMTWKILWIIRQRFESDKLFGQYVEEYRANSTHGNSVGSQQAVNTAWLAGKFCETYKINNLSAVGVSKSVVYELSRPMNEEISGEVFKTIKARKEHITFYEVKRLLNQARSIDTTSADEGGSNECKNDYLDVAESGKSDSADTYGVIVDADDEDRVIGEIISLVRSQESVEFVKKLISELQKMVVDSTY